MDATSRRLGQLSLELKGGREEAEKLLAYVEARPAEVDFPYLINTDDFDLESILAKSQLALPGFATLDTGLASRITYILEDLKDYKEDESRKRPHNLLMLAFPGTGKSHLVKCLAKHLEIPLITGNLSMPDTLSVLAYVVNEARNYKAQDELPLLFLDEVDTNASENVSALLPLLWDGELFVSGQVMKLGRCMIICAMSALKLEVPKTNDFLSRFDGGVLEVDTVNGMNRRLDKVCITAALIKRRFPKIRYVSLGLLQFLGQIEVEHEIRSLEFLVNLIPEDSVRTRSPGDQARAWLKPDEWYISLSEKLNRQLRRRFESLLARDLATRGPLSLHIKEGTRQRVLQCWKRSVRQIGLVRV